MIVNLLDHFLLSQVFAFMMLSTRFGAFLMALPAFGDSYVSVRVRVMLALALSLMMMPLLESAMPAVPGSPLLMLSYFAAEIFIGVFFGLIARAITSTMHVAGTAIANQSSLALAAIFDSNAGVQSSIVANLYSLMGLMLMIALDLHHILFAAIMQSYTLFPAGIWPETGDMSMLFNRKMADAFLLGVQFSMPHIIMLLLIYLLGGVMGRLMPTFQVFFVLMPGQILVATLLIFALIAPMAVMYGQYLQEAFMQFALSIGRTN
jgi:flagellar biosynthetic protein FliR